MKTSAFLIALIALIALAACANSPDFPAPTAQWETFTGQLQYVTKERSVIGEFTAARHSGEFRLEFSKAGAVTLLKLARHGDVLRAEGPLARGRWQGASQSAPAHLSGWASVPAGFDGFERNARITSNATRPEIVFDRGRPKTLSLPGAQPGERFTFHFN